MSHVTTNNPKDFWTAVLGEVEMKISPMVFKTMVARTSVDEITGSKVKISCDDDFVKNNIQKKYYDLIQNAVKKITGSLLDIEVSVRKNAKSTETHPLGPLFQQNNNEALLKEKQTKSNLSAKYTFDTYIMGKSNQLAFAIAKAVADKPGELYNPVFIYSGVGLGKTHLMQAIGNHILKNKPGTKVIYTTGEAFTNELIEAIQSGKGKGKYTTNEFRNKFRKADVFLIDDVQFIIGREATQEEFFHTFNELYMAQKQIVITSDKPPRDFNNLESRITSRFGSGIIVDIQNPDSEMRAAILRTKRDSYGDDVSNVVIDFIAQRVDTNIRELEGAYTQFVTFAKATGKSLSLETAALALGQTLKDKQPKPVNLNQILKAVCNYYAVKSTDIKGTRRTKELVIPRQVAMYLIKDLTNTPLMTIGEFLGGRDHTTIMHGVDKINAEIAQETKISKDITQVKQLIYAE